MSLWNLSPESEQDIRDLRKYRRLPSRLAGSRRILPLIDRLVSRNQPVVISDVASCLFSRSKPIHNAAAQGLERLLSLVPSMELIRISESFRGAYSGYVSDRWNDLTPKRVASFLSKTNDVAVGSLMSFHHNGYVRHAAIRFLSKVDSGKELRFLLIRQNDWVDSISEDAQSMIRSKLTHEYLQHFVGETDLLFLLLRCKRRDLTSVAAKYVDMRIKPEHRRLLQKAIGCCDSKPERSFIDYVLRHDGDHLADSVRSGVISNDGVIRLKCLKRTGDCLSHTEGNELADRMMSDKFMPVRHEAFMLKTNLSPDSSNQVWQQCLLDRNRALRGTAIFYLEKSRLRRRGNLPQALVQCA